MPNRTLCDVLTEIRTCYETRNFSYLMGLIEEAQSMGNRMEAALWDQSDIKHAEKRKKALEKKVAELEKKVEDLEDSAGIKSED